MKRQRITRWMMASIVGFSGLSQAEILVALDPDAATALYDSDKKGIVSDAGVQPPDNPSGVPVIENAGDHPHSAGFTFNVSFTPQASDLTGTKVLIEIGGNSNGTGLYLIGGVPTLLSKQGAQATTHPESLNDTTLPSIGVQSGIGVLEAGVTYSFAASWNHAGTLELRVKEAGGEAAEVFNSFNITGVFGNWSGNDTLSVKTLNTGNAGGLARDTTNGIDPRFNTNAAQVASFAGVVHRAVFWNASDVTPPVLSEPEIKGFSITRLPSTGKLRLHWNISEGGLPNPTTAEIRETGVTGGAPLYTVPEGSLVGFTDLETTVTSFTLDAVNATGAAQATAEPEQETAHSAVIRAAAPLAWYRFNETSGSQHLVDSAENEAPNDGTVLGETIAGGTGFIDGAAVYAGSSTVLSRQILNPGSTDPEEPKGFTVEAVVWHSSASTADGTILSQQDVDGVGRQIISVRPDGTLFSVLGGTTRASAARLVPESWNHLVFVVDPDRGQFRWYVNGKLADLIAPGSGYTLESTDGGWVIGSGKNLASNLYKGKLDEIAVYRDLLDDPDRDGDPADSKISAHHQAWYQLTKGILFFRGTASTVVTGTPLDFLAHLGADVTSVTIDNGIGSVPVGADRHASATDVFPTASATYTLTATGDGGATYTATFAVTYNQLTVPVILGFEATTLPSPDGVEPDKVRLHWAATAGDFPTPVTGKITYGTGGVFDTTDLRGFLDIPATEATDVKIEFTNLIGSSELDAPAPAPDTAHSAVIRAAAPVAWFRFNESVFSGLIVDSAGGAAPHDGVLRNNIAVNLGATGFIDGAGTFNNAGAILTDRIIDPVDENLLGFTIEAIVETNPGTGTANRILVSQQDTSPFSGRQILSVDDTGFVRSNVGGGTALYSTGKAPARAWSHLVGTIDFATKEVRWYIDGQFAGSAFSPAYFEPSQGAWVIGAAKGLDGNFWRGKIDDLIVYDKILDESEIVAHRDAWWEQTSGLLYVGPETATIDAGGQVALSIKVGHDVTGVSISPGTSIPIDGSAPGSVRGSATVTLTPSQTTTYTITYQTPSGPVTKTITVTVNGGTAAALELVAHRIEGGNFIIEFRGAPSTTYAVKGSDDLASFPTDHGTVTTDGTGAGTAVIAIDPGKPREFFRIEATN